MKLNKGNYELFFMNYHEKMFSEKENNELINFLAIHPYLLKEFEDMKNFIYLTPSVNIKLKDKDIYKKNIGDKDINAKNIYEFLIAYLEEDLSLYDIQRLETFLKSNVLYFKDLEILRKTFLIPDLTKTYLEKHKLKKNFFGGVLKLKHILHFSAVAAGLIIVVNIFSVIEPLGTSQKNVNKQLNKETDKSIEKAHVNPIEHLSTPIAQTNDLQKKQANQHVQISVPPMLHANMHRSVTDSYPIQNTHNILPFQAITNKDALYINVQNNQTIFKDNRKEFTDIYNYVKISELSSLDEDAQKMTLNPTKNETGLKSNMVSFYENNKEQIDNIPIINNFKNFVAHAEQYSENLSSKNYKKNITNTLSENKELISENIPGGRSIKAASNFIKEELFEEKEPILKRGLRFGLNTINNLTGMEVFSVE